MMLYISMKFNENIKRFPRYRADTKFQLSNFKGRITLKLYRQESCFFCSARRLMMFYNCMKFLENILKRFQVIERTRLTDGRTDDRQKQYVNPYQGRHNLTSISFHKRLYLRLAHNVCEV